jgi:hypothetical protein
MAVRLQANADAADIPVTLGDFATAAAGGPYSLVYLLRNTITNLTSQDEWGCCVGRGGRDRAVWLGRAERMRRGSAVRPRVDRSAFAGSDSRRR